MDITSISNISSEYIRTAAENTYKEKSEDFESLFQSMMGMVGETNELQNAAESAEIQFALGESVNTHDLQVAQEKANTALQYTVAVRDKLLQAYQEIMNMQI